MSRAVLLALCFSGPVADAGPRAPYSHWINPSKSVVVEIAMCGGVAFCGHVRWASSKAVADAGAKGTYQLVGTELLHSFAPAGPGRWKGRLFVPGLRWT